MKLVFRFIGSAILVFIVSAILFPNANTGSKTFVVLWLVVSAFMTISSLAKDEEKAKKDKMDEAVQRYLDKNNENKSKN